MPSSLSQFSSYIGRRSTDQTGVVATLAGIASGIVKIILRWDDLSRQRRALSRLDDRLLRDVALTRDQAKSEVCHRRGLT